MNGLLQALDPNVLTRQKQWSALQADRLGYQPTLPSVLQVGGQSRLLGSLGP